MQVCLQRIKVFMTAQKRCFSEIKETWIELNHYGNPLIDLSLCLEGGQAFHWKRISSTNTCGNAIEWISVLDEYIVRLCYEYKDSLAVKVLFSFISPKGNLKYKDHSERVHEVLVKYFRLRDGNLRELLSEWRKMDKSGYFERLIPKDIGLYLLDQDPFLTMLSFICSANNRINRITKMVQYLCQNYGKYMENIHDTDFYSFPTLDCFKSCNTDTLEEQLKKNGFGYRAKYISHTIEQLGNRFNYSHQKMMDWFTNTLYLSTLEQVIQSLIEFPGIGRKVADCIALFSLNQLQVVPMDTHMISIAKRHYGLTDSRATSSYYDKATRIFLNLFPRKPGWAHLFLYVSDLDQTFHQ